MNNNEETVHNEDQRMDCPKDQKACPGKCTNRQIVRREALLQAKSSLIDTIIYHIRTLSNAVVGFSDLLGDEPLSEEGNEFVQEIHHAGQGLSALANQVLDWTQLLSGKLEIINTKFLLTDILNELQKILSWAARKKGLDYEIVTDPDMPAYLQTDQDRLLKCLVNLTVSAIKHTYEGSVRIHVQTEDLQDELFVRFDVVDSGTGISPEKLDTIFDPTLYRIEVDEEILSQLEQGLMVTTGLPLTKQLCQLLGGSITVNSRENEGTTFSLKIPAGVDPAKESKLGTYVWQENATVQQQDGPQTEAKPTSAKVLLVEDQPSNRTVITLMLEALGIEVETAENGMVALDRCKSKTYELILMDLKMPKMDGYETTRQLKQNGVKGPIVALSATVTTGQEKKCISELFDGFLTKPVNSENLISTVEQFLENVTPAQKNTCFRSDDQGHRQHEITATDHDTQTR